MARSKSGGNDVRVDILRTSASGQFFCLTSPLSSKQVEQIFGQYEKKSKAKAWICCEPRSSPRAFKYSFLCFQRTNPAPFLDADGFDEITYAFLLLVEIDLNGKPFLGVFKRGVASVDKCLDGVCIPLPRSQVAHLFGNQATYEKLSLRRMTISRSEMRASSYEADDLQVVMPTLAISRSIPRHLRLRHGKNGVFSITPSTARIHKAGGRTTLDQLVELLWLVASEVEKNPISNFLSSFPSSIDFAHKGKIKPVGVLFDWFELFEEDSGYELKEQNAHSKLLDVNAKTFLGEFGNILEVSEKAGQLHLIANRSVVANLRESKTAYSIIDFNQRSFAVTDTKTGESQKLTDWIKSHQNFSVVFSEPEYFYTNGGLYYRANFNAEVKLVKDLFAVCKQLSKATSEKGEPTISDTEFPSESIFRILEDHWLNNEEYLLCTDLGDEWADYISVDSKRLVFAHCKGEEDQLGASAYHVVVAQALKNLGRAQATPAEFTAKIKSSGGKKKKTTWGDTKIERMRQPLGDLDGFVDMISRQLEQPDFTREVHIVVSSLSKKSFEAEEVKAKKKPSFIQLVWLLSSFATSCREMGAKPVIVCRE